MWSDQQFGQAAVSAVGNIFDFLQKDKQAQSDQAWRNYDNAMAKIGDANNQNTLTINERLADDHAALQRLAISKSAFSTQGDIVTAAATANTSGRSVQRSLLMAAHNANTQLNSVADDLEKTYLQIDEQRRQSTMQAVESQDFTAIPRPTGASQILGFAGDLRKINGE